MAPKDVEIMASVRRDPWLSSEQPAWKLHGSCTEQIMEAGSEEAGSMKQAGIPLLEKRPIGVWDEPP
jgi:hypothetical protein